MNRKRLLVLAGLLLAAAVVVPVALRLHAYCHKLARSRLIDAEHYGRLREGTGHAEVEQILGGPSGDFHTEDVYYAFDQLPLPTDGGRGEGWVGNEGAIIVRFDEQGVARSLWFAEATESPLADEGLRRWLRRLWP